ncbi:MAG: TSUP family transporter, partial [Planctomycetota bacterium]
MDYLVVCLSALVIALLTLFSGFGLGTLLMPVFAVFFPVEVAVAATAVVHLANNVFKLALVGRHADRAVVIRFGIPAVVAAFAGAAALGLIGGLPSIADYAWAGRRCEITALKLVIAVLIIVFALFDLLPALRRLSVDRKYLPLGGVLS